MNIVNLTKNITYLFLDTAPVIYYVERNPYYYQTAKLFFNLIDKGRLQGVTSPVTLAECLVIPHRLEQKQLVQDFEDLIVYGNNTIFVPIDNEAGNIAANLRANYNLTLPDALQIAVAIITGCQAFLTNDIKLKRVNELQVLVLDEIKQPED